jgi:hypothetical protein
MHERRHSRALERTRVRTPGSALEPPDKAKIVAQRKETMEKPER